MCQKAGDPCLTWYTKDALTWTLFQYSYLCELNNSLLCMYFYPFQWATVSCAFKSLRKGNDMCFFLLSLKSALISVSPWPSPPFQMSKPGQQRLQRRGKPQPSGNSEAEDRKPSWLLFITCHKEYRSLGIWHIKQQASIPFCDMNKLMTMKGQLTTRWSSSIGKNRNCLPLYFCTVLKCHSSHIPQPSLILAELRSSAESVLVSIWKGDHKEDWPC